MNLRIIHNKEEVKLFLEHKNKANFMFHLNDIEDYFWDYNQFYGLYEEDELKAIAIFCIEYGFPILVSSSYTKEDTYQDELLKRLNDFMPGEMYCHLNIDEYKILELTRYMKSREKFYNMKLNKEKFLDAFKEYHSEIDVLKIEISEREELVKFLEENHPDYMLKEKFLRDGLYKEIRLDDKIVAVCGIFSDSKEVIQIGNVSTHVDYRKRGLAKRCLYEMIKDLIYANKEIVLNVLQNNRKAYNLYTKIGFEVIGEFEEVMFE